MLVAHNGFNFDFLFLMEEIRRCNLKESFEKVDLWFADTWYDANRVSSWLTNIYMYLYTYSHVCYSLILNLWPLLKLANSIYHGSAHFKIGHCINEYIRALTYIL